MIWHLSDWRGFLSGMLILSIFIDDAIHVLHEEVFQGVRTILA